MSTNSIVQRAMTNAWLSQQGVPSIRTTMGRHSLTLTAPRSRKANGASQLKHDESMRSKQLRHAYAGIRPIAGYGPVRPVVWEGPVQTQSLPDSTVLLYRQSGFHPSSRINGSPTV